MSSVSLWLIRLHTQRKQFTEAGVVLEFFVMRDPKNKDKTIVRVSGEEERIVDRPYDEIADLIGSVTGLPPDLSEGTGARFAEIILPAAR